METVMEQILAIRISKEDKLKLGLKAEQMGLNVSSLLRLLIKQYANGSLSLVHTPDELIKAE
jgi:antitoxin component of RelBE/YafQ-DinJ toxin-antitoxin module